jgi:hypothetical protein
MWSEIYALYTLVLTEDEWSVQPTVLPCQRKSPQNPLQAGWDPVPIWMWFQEKNLCHYWYQTLAIQSRASYLNDWAKHIISLQQNIHTKYSSDNSYI